MCISKMFYYYNFYLKTSRRRNFLGSYDSIYLTPETHSPTFFIFNAVESRFFDVGRHCSLNKKNNTEKYHYKSVFKYVINKNKLYP